MILSPDQENFFRPVDIRSIRRLDLFIQNKRIICFILPTPMPRHFYINYDCCHLEFYLKRSYSVAGGCA